MLFSIILIIAIGFLVPLLYKKLLNRITTNNVRCSSCKTTFRAKDIVDETLAGDGLTNGGKMRKIIVTMRCFTCGEEKKISIYTTHRHHPAKGSPARQYFKELEEKEWAQMTKQNKKKNDD